MRPFVLSLVLATVGSVSALADHDLTALRHQYNAQRDGLEADYRARLDDARYAYHRERDQLLNERRQIARLACHKTRAAQFRQNSHALADAAKCFAASNREIGRWVRNERENLREAYEADRHLVRHGGLLINEHAHPDDCSCHTCRPPLPQPPRLGPPVVYEPVPRPVRSSRQIDWAGLILRLLLDG